MAGRSAGTCGGTIRTAARLAVGSVLLLAAAAAFAGDAPLTNADVVGMVDAGFGSVTIVANIKASPTDFKLDTASLAVLTQQGVPEAVIQAMIERQSTARSDAAPPLWPRGDARNVWGDVVRAVDRCRSRGEAMLFDAGVQFAPIEDSTACVETDTAFAVAWDQVDTVSFKYAVLDDATVGVATIRTKAGKSYQLRGSQMTVQSMEGEFKFQQPRLGYRCD